MMHLSMHRRPLVSWISFILLSGTLKPQYNTEKLFSDDRSDIESEDEIEDSNHMPEEEDKDELASEEPTVHPPLASGASTPPHPVTPILSTPPPPSTPSGPQVLPPNIPASPLTPVGTSSLANSPGHDDVDHEALNIDIYQGNEFGDDEDEGMYPAPESDVVGEGEVLPEDAMRKRARGQSDSSSVQASPPPKKKTTSKWSSRLRQGAAPTESLPPLRGPSAPSSSRSGAPKPVKGRGHK